MKRNILITGFDTQLNEAVAREIADGLGLYYLSLPELILYYANRSSKEIVIKEGGKLLYEKYVNIAVKDAVEFESMVAAGSFSDFGTKHLQSLKETALIVFLGEAYSSLSRRGIKISADIANRSRYKYKYGYDVFINVDTVKKAELTSEVLKTSQPITEDKMSKFDVELVGKVGSIALIDREHKDINYSIIARISRELRPGFIWVTSGATEIGRLDYLQRTGKELDGTEEDNKTDYSAQGQSVLMAWYRQFLDSRFSLRQILVEHQHFNDADKREYLKRVLLRCPLQNAIPIVNYNDAVCYEENRKMEIQALLKSKHGVVECVDNDETASQIACLVKAERLLILTSVDGIYDDPNNKDTLVPEIAGKDVYELIENIEAHQASCNGASRKGANGARAKLEYIKAPVKNGTEVIIANSKYGISEILAGKAPRTVIHVK
jgi:Glutamate 5-kinase